MKKHFSNLGILLSIRLWNSKENDIYIIWKQVKRSVYNCGLAASRASYLPKKGRAKGRLPASSMASITPCYMAMLTATYSPSNQIRVEKREGDAHLTYSKRKRLTLHSVCRGETNQNNTVGVFFFWKEEEEENKAGQKRDENRSPKATANPKKKEAYRQRMYEIQSSCSCCPATQHLTTGWNLRAETTDGVKL